MLARFSAMTALAAFTLTSAPIVATPLEVPGWTAEAAPKKVKQHVRAKHKVVARGKASSVSYNSYRVTPSGYVYR